MKNTLQNLNQLSGFLKETLPNEVPCLGSSTAAAPPETLMQANDFVADVQAGVRRAPMSIRLTPHLLSCIDWADPMNDPLRRQFVALASTAKPDHPQLKFDSLDETGDSPVKGIVHRYPDKALFLGEQDESMEKKGESNRVTKSHRSVRSTAASVRGHMQSAPRPRQPRPRRASCQSSRSGSRCLNTWRKPRDYTMSLSRAATL